MTVLNIAVGRPNPKVSGHIRTMANMIFLLPQRICALIGYTMATNLKKKNNTVRRVGRKVKRKNEAFLRGFQLDKTQGGRLSHSLAISDLGTRGIILSKLRTLY